MAVTLLQMLCFIGNIKSLARKRYFIYNNGLLCFNLRLNNYQTESSANANKRASYGRARFGDYNSDVPGEFYPSVFQPNIATHIPSKL